MRAEYVAHENTLRTMIEVEELTQLEAARRLGKHVTTIERWCKRFQLHTQRTGPRAGAGHPDWRGGRRRVKGYWYIWMPEHPRATKAGYILEHRLVMEATLGRYLDIEEVVHHIDKNREHNDPSNLRLFPCNGDHLRHELTGHRPKWSPGGHRRILAAVARVAESRRRSRADARRRPRPTARRSS